MHGPAYTTLQWPAQRQEPAGSSFPCRARGGPIAADEALKIDKHCVQEHDPGEVDCGLLSGESALDQQNSPPPNC
ncbi:unnamed protein product [Parascedosporium putredinis]|uniref:Uncharacterized protein n=1 Tax=Parascedosporium putredinis TaxID=1442378 RepID=A0A9P1HA25_9PEZI|nr:unnamed protein product [Parascedosporium putredinis]CAI8001418.1 unnamed protein product [Parascedosporium putredinis]